VEEEALEHIARTANGDIRRALNALELAAMTTPPNLEGEIHVTMDVAVESIRKPLQKADKSTQYDVLSAFHKSVRGSSDAALLWFFYAVEKLGMDPRIFIRRLIVACSEDIGLANPQAMPQAVSALDAYEKIGWPESKYIVAQAILFAVESPKSNAVARSIDRVYHTINKSLSMEVPKHLRDTHYTGSEQLGHQGYKYPHEYPNHYVKQQYVPDELTGISFYEPTEQGTEEKIKKNQTKRREE
jgi:putative ATPase